MAASEEELEAARRRVEREKIQPTDDRLRLEVAEICNVMGHVWDGEVEVLAALVRRTDGRVSWATTANSRERLKMILSRIKSSSLEMDMIIKRNVPQ